LGLGFRVRVSSAPITLVDILNFMPCFLSVWLGLGLG